MHELEKIAEARFFYSRMVQAKEHQEDFKHNLSAFLSSARSVLQYARKEAKTKAGGRRWYDSQISGSRVAGFFKDKRDINIHAEPVSVRQDIDAAVSDTIRLSDSVSIEVRNSEGNITGRFESPAKPVAPGASEPSTIEIRYRFADWTGGSENVFALSEEYLNDLEAIVADGRSKGFLT